MALGLKYYYSFNDEWDRIHCVQILKEGYSGNVTELTKVGDPPVILTKPSDGNKFQSIQGKEIALKLLSTTDMKFSEFFTATNRDYLIRYWIEDSTNTDLLTNGNFSAWTGDDPDNWTVGTTNVDQSPAGVCRIVDSENERIFQVPSVTSGYPYIVEFTLSVNMKDSDIGLLGSVKTITTETGTYKDLQIGTATDEFEISTGSQEGEHEIGIDDVSCKLMDLIFEGYLTPDMYYEPFIAYPYTVTLRATDGLGDLKNRLFESAADTPYTGQQDLLDVIEICLDETGLALDIISACNIFETNMNKTDADDPLPQTYVNQEVYREDLITGWNCYDVLVDIMTCIGSKLEQINGAWHIIPLRELAETSYDRRKYNSSGTYQSNDSKSPQLTVTVPTAGEATLCCWSRDSQMLEIIPAYKEFTILQDCGYLDNLLENGEFEREFWTDANTPKSWGKSEVGTWLKRFEDGAELTGVSVDWNNAKKIYKLIDYYDGGFGAFLDIEIDYIIQCPGVGGADLILKIKVTGGPDYVTADGTFSGADTQIIVASCNGTEIINGTYKLVTDNIPAAAGTKIIALYINQPWIAGDSGQKIIIKKVKMNIIRPSGLTYEKENKILTSINTNYQFKPSDINVNIGGRLYGGADEEAVYKGFLLDSSGDGLNNLWHHKGEADNDDLLDHTAADIENNYDAPTYKLRGTIHSKVMDFNTVLKEGNLSNKIFIPGQMSYDPLRGLWTGEWLEVVTN